MKSLNRTNRLHGRPPIRLKNEVVKQQWTDLELMMLCGQIQDAYLSGKNDRDLIDFLKDLPWDQINNFVNRRSKRILGLRIVDGFKFAV